MTDLLEVAHLSVSYGGGGMRAFRRRAALDVVLGVSFTIPAATTFAIVGESGSGKSTLGRAIMGLTRFQAGGIHVAGDTMPDRGEAQLRPWRRQMAMMFQDAAASLSPRLTVRRLITEPFDIHGYVGRFGAKERDAECRRLLALVGLPADFAERYPHQLSGGQARRVGVARALALSPRLIIADEPTAGLDVSVQGEILNLMRRLQDENGLTYLLITHNLAVVRHVSDQMAVMYMGRFVEQGKTATIYEEPAHPYTHGLLAAQPDLDPDKRREDVELKGDVPSLAARPAGCEFHTRCPAARPRCTTETPVARLVAGRLVRCHFALAH